MMSFIFFQTYIILIECIMEIIYDALHYHKEYNMEILQYPGLLEDTLDLATATITPDYQKVRARVVDRRLDVLDKQFMTFVEHYDELNELYEADELTVQEWKEEYNSRIIFLEELYAEHVKQQFN